MAEVSAERRLQASDTGDTLLPLWVRLIALSLFGITLVHLFFCLRRGAPEDRKMLFYLNAVGACFLQFLGWVALTGNIGEVLVMWAENILMMIGSVVAVTGVDQCCNALPGSGFLAGLGMGSTNRGSTMIRAVLWLAAIFFGPLLLSSCVFNLSSHEGFDPENDLAIFGDSYLITAVTVWKLGCRDMRPSILEGGEYEKGTIAKVLATIPFVSKYVATQSPPDIMFGFDVHMLKVIFWLLLVLAVVLFVLIWVGPPIVDEAVLLATLSVSLAVSLWHSRKLAGKGAPMAETEITSA